MGLLTGLIRLGEGWANLNRWLQGEHPLGTVTHDLETQEELRDDGTWVTYNVCRNCGAVNPWYAGGRCVGVFERVLTPCDGTPGDGGEIAPANTP
jgi:hypothetical protein